MLTATRRRGVIGAAAVVLAAAAALGSCVPAQAANAGFGPLSGSGGCLVAPGANGSGGCGEGKGLVAPTAVAVSPDGSNVYVVSGTSGSDVATSFGSLAILKREPATGAISEVGCWSSDGTDGRDGASGACTPTPTLLGADGVAVSPDGATVYVSSSFSGGVIAFARNPADGSLTRLGCLQFSPPGGSPCRPANVFPGSGALVVSPNNRSLYVAAPTPGAISTLTAPAVEASPAGSPAPSGPEPTAASLFGVPAAQSLANPCVAVNGLEGDCGVGIATQGLGSLTLSPDGKQLYGAAPTSSALDVFTLGGAGELTETGCLKIDPPPGLCGSSKLTASPTQLAISPDGRNVYAAASSDTGGRIEIFNRESSSGALTGAGCIDDLPPEKHPEDKEEEEEEQEQEKHEPAPKDPCTSVPGLEGGEVLAVSGDGSSVYAIGSDSEVTFTRNASTGALTEASCADSEDNRCTSMPSLSGVDGAAVSTDGREVYVTAKAASEVIVFESGAAVTTSDVRVTAAGLARVGVACPAGQAGPCVGHVALLRSLAAASARAGSRRAVRRIGAGDSVAFRIRPGGHASISVHLSASTLRRLRSRRRLRLLAEVLARPNGGGSGDGRAITFRLRR
jgi:DNA-binding beta-propeller fold protein YncE